MQRMPCLDNARFLLLAGGPRLVCVDSVEEDIERLAQFVGAQVARGPTESQCPLLIGSGIGRSAGEIPQLVQPREVFAQELGTEQALLLRDVALELFHQAHDVTAESAMPEILVHPARNGAAQELSSSTHLHSRLAPLFVGHAIYRQAAYGSNHPLAIARVESVMDLCSALGWLGESEFRDSPRAGMDQLAWFHALHYVQALRHASETGRVDFDARRRYAIGTMENPVFPGVFERAATSVGGSILAAELALEGRIVFHPAGGTHHGRPDRASGFCYFNDPVFAILAFLKAGVERVVYIDLDAHHGDGVQDAFVRDERVRTISLHERGRWPYSGDIADRGEGRACNLPVPAHINDSELGVLLEEVVLPLTRTAAPQALVVTCGADALGGDPLSSMQLSNVALWSAVERVAALAPAVVVLGGGGYNPWTLARYWSGLWGRLSAREIPRELPADVLAILRGLRCDLIDDEDIRPEWLTTLADRPSRGAVRDEIRVLADRALACVDESAWTPVGDRASRQAVATN
jgi:acetoin utilization protein AcuC